MPTLHWIGKDAVVNHHRQVPFHLLKDVPELACGEPGEGNLIVQGDNLVALKALLPYYAGQVKCIYIDPPYNTGIRQHRDSERKEAFGQWLAFGSALTVSEERTINFHEKGYEPSELYEGSFQFKKHYFGPKPGELREKKADGKMTEEFECAQFIDGLPEVKFWVRNLARKSTSFRLQTSKDWFYPDFICQLNDGRVLAVEYKGAHLYDGNDAGDKRAVGAVWAARSGGRCLFAMPTDGDFSAITSAMKQ